MTRIRADFNGLFGKLLCLSHGDGCVDESGTNVSLIEGMVVTVFDDDLDERGERVDIVASGTVERSPDWLQCSGSRWVLQIDERGIRYEAAVPEGK